MNNTANIELIQIRKGAPDAYMVKMDGQVIGFLEKYRSTRTETHPWKAFGAKLNPAGDGYMYAPELAFQCFYTGKDAAITFLRRRAKVTKILAFC